MKFSLRPVPAAIPLWLRLALLALVLAGIFGVAGCEPVANWLRDALPRTGRDVG